MKYYLMTNEDGRLSALSEGELADGVQMELPEDFDFEHIADYRLIDGELVHEPLPAPDVQTDAEKIESLTNQVTDLQMAICDLFETMSMMA